jgi:sugar lactone lactonase YvrE
VPIGGTFQGTPLLLAGTVTTIAGTVGAPGSTDATGSDTRFNRPVGITTDGKNLYIADAANNTIRKLVIASGVVTTLTGNAAETPATVDGTGAEARFYQPNGITTDGTNLYVAEMQSNSIRKVVISTREVTTLKFVTLDGDPTILSSPSGITTDGLNLFVTDSANHTVRKVVISTGVVTILAGSTGTPGSDDLIGTDATFNQPVGITTDGSNLYVNDFGSGKIRKIVIADGAVSTVAGGFTTPATGITTDGTNLYVADYGNNTISTIVISSKTVTQIPGTDLVFNHPEGITSNGTALFIADSGSNTIRKLN